MKSMTTAQIDVNSSKSLTGGDDFGEVWMGYTDKEEEGNFISYRNRKPLILDGMKWGSGEPNNNGGDQDCVLYSSEFETLVDYDCKLKYHAACKVTGFISFTLDGVCEESAVDSHYVLQPNGVILGYLRTEMIWNGTTKQWEIWNKEKRTLVATMNKTIGFPLGTFPWNITDVDCTDDGLITRRLNLHLQVDRPGKYCCGDGVCLDSKIVCDGNRNCDDGSDENTGCCKTSGKLRKHITETLYGVFFVFLGSYDCQIWAIFHFGTLWAYG